MTPKQLLQRIETELKAMVWGATANRVFGDSVFIVPEFPVEQLGRFRSPAAFIVDQGGPFDGEHPGIMYQDFTVGVFIENLTSAYGSAVMTGGIRTSNASPGAGILDLEDEMLSKLVEIVTMTTKAMLLEKSTQPVHGVSGDNFPRILRIFSFSAVTSFY